jgi:hypothetical protein
MAGNNTEKPGYLEVHELENGTYTVMRVDAPTARRIKITAYEPVVEQYISNLITAVNKEKDPNVRKKQLEDRLKEMLGY